MKRQECNPTSTAFEGHKYLQDDLEFIRAMAAYMKMNKRRFPTFVEILRVAKSLGYRKVQPPDVPPDVTLGQSPD